MAEEVQRLRDPDSEENELLIREKLQRQKKGDMRFKPADPASRQGKASFGAATDAPPPRAARPATGSYASAVRTAWNSSSTRSADCASAAIRNSGSVLEART